jgi:hypothetical protein
MCISPHHLSTVSSIQMLPVCSMIVSTTRFADTPMSDRPTLGEISRRGLSKRVI